MVDKAIFRKHISPLRPIPTGVRSRGDLPNPVVAVLFDVYGTLLVSGAGEILPDGGDGIRAREIARLLEDYGRSGMSPEEVSAAFRSAVSAAHQQGAATGVSHPEIIVENLWKTILGFENITIARNFAMEYELIVNPVYPMPGLTETIRALRDREVVMGIVSNAQFYTPLLLLYFLGKQLYHSVFSKDLIFFSYKEKNAKPSPDMFRKASTRLENMGIPPSRVLFVGNDMKIDVVPARQSGFCTALFAGDQRSLRLRSDDPLVANVFPDITVTSLPEIVSAVRRA